MALSLFSRVFLSTVCIVVFFLGSFLNITLFIILISSKEHRKRVSSLYLLSLLSMQILACFSEAPYYFFSLVLRLPSPPQEQYRAACRVSMFATYTIAALKLLALTIMSLDRYLAIVFPFVYERFVSISRVIICIGLNWVISLLCFSPLLIMKSWTTYEGTFGYACGVDFHKTNGVYIVLIGVFLVATPLCLMLLANTKVYITARRQNLRVQNERSKASGKTIGETFTRHQESELMHCKKENVKPSLKKTMSLKPPSAKGSDLNDRDKEYKAKCHSLNQLSQDYGATDERQKARELGAVDGTELKEVSKFLKANADWTKTDNRHFNNNFVLNAENLVEEAVGDKAMNGTQSETDFAFSGKKKQSSILKGKEVFTIGNSCNKKQIKSAKQFDMVSSSENTTTTKKSKQTVLLNSQKEKKEQVSHCNRSTTSWNIISSTLLFVLVFFITYFPFLVTRFLETFFSTIKLGDEAFTYTALITTTGNLVNPAIVLGTRRKLRLHFMRVIFRKEL
ncbi:probable G-protein coupled receptor 101 [Rhopilema esculentum]|uniref:probable G-protein coupled receptor 101 n=1 Tax=Rhopilema esculentum TaxID=499914 RepID=UPI0031E2342E|eukprot:gene4908-21242_t